MVTFACLFVSRPKNENCTADVYNVTHARSPVYDRTNNCRCLSDKTITSFKNMEYIIHPTTHSVYAQVMAWLASTTKPNLRLPLLRM